MARILILLLICSTLHAKDFGIVGHTFRISEQDIVEYIKERISTITPEEQEKIAAIAKERIETIKTPKPLNLPNATSNRSFYFDPSITANEDIKDSEGVVIVSKGTYYNPLEHVSLSNDLLFFDATQESHLTWAEHTQGLWILTKGKPIELEGQKGFPVYFDQGGSLSKKLGIRAIPARVTQDGTSLKVEEFDLGDGL
jgi:conjugal transfer pilus assembly protein TraW